MRVVVAPDKFKGSLSALEVSRAVAAGVARARANAELLCVPLADGGDGTVDAAVSAGYERVTVEVDGPTGKPVTASYARCGDRAVVELANACGLALVPRGRPAPLDASTFGLGQVLGRAVADGARQVVVGLGGSAGTDGGAGLLQALGARLMDASGADVPRGGRGLGTVIRLELDELRARLHGVRIELALDVDNPLYGPSGAAAVYGPQKGATHEQVIQLDAALRQWAAVVARTTGVDRSSDPGAGAAGGAGFAALAVLGAEPRMGVELLAEVVGLESRLPGADLVITGEGSLDEQTLRGKTIAGVCRLARAHGVPVAAIAGVLRLTGEQQRELGLVRAVALSDLDPRRSFTDAARLVSEAAARLVTAATGYGGDADQ